MEEGNKLASIIFLGLIMLDLIVWHHILTLRPTKEAELHFLDVGQGDAELITLHGIHILIDAGNNSRIADALSQPLRKGKYIDIGLITHPQKDHFGGFDDVLDHYRMGVLITNGRAAKGDGEETWNAIMEKVKKEGVPLVTVGAGDRISYKNNHIDILSPDRLLVESAEPNDTSIVARLTTPAFRALFTGDIGTNVEHYLAEKSNLFADILKVPHHGSKYSSSELFLQKVRPEVAVIQVGKNRYGHPAPEARARIETIGAATFRTDHNGTIRIKEHNGVLEVSLEKQN